VNCYSAGSTTKCSFPSESPTSRRISTMGSCSGSFYLSTVNNSTSTNSSISNPSLIGRDDKASRITNFTLLYDTFKILRVSFDSNIAMNIIEKKTGIAKKVLY
jgi:hypothetical protein